MKKKKFLFGFKELNCNFLNWKDLMLFHHYQECWDLWHYYNYLWDNLPADTSGYDEWFKRVVASQKGTNIYDRGNSL